MLRYLDQIKTFDENVYVQKMKITIFFGGGRIY